MRSDNLWPVAIVAVAIAAACPTSRDEPGLPTLGGRPLIPTRWTAGCGLDALYLCLQLNGLDVGYAELVAKSGVTSVRRPISLARLWQLAGECGGHAVAIRVVKGPDALATIMRDASVRSAIVHLKAVERDGRREEEHFYAVLLVKDKLRVLGQSTGEQEPAQDWADRWSGAALLVSAHPIALRGLHPADAFEAAPKLVEPASRRAPASAPQRQPRTSTAETALGCD